MSITAGVPAIDHHSHASAYQSGGRYRSVQDHADHFNTGHLESRIPSAVYREYVQARNVHDTAALETLDQQYGIQALLDEGRQFRSTTFFATALRKGSSLLYNSSDESKFEELGEQLRDGGVAAPYDTAAEVANTPTLLVDVKSIDAASWDPRRYRQIIRIDPYLYPFGFDPRDDRGTEADRFLNIFAGVRGDEMRASGLDDVPRTLDGWEAFVLESLARRRQGGAIGYKIVSAYVRTLAFTRAIRSDASREFEKLARGEAGDRGVLADYLVTRIAVEAGEHRVPIQIHTGMGHPEPGMYVRNADPLNLESWLLQPELNQVSIVLIHGAYPFTSHAAALAQTYGNVYLDFSWMPYLHHEHLRLKLVEWMEILPANKLLFGSDTGLPEFHVAAAHFAREALDAALQSGMQRNVWTAGQADFLAERILFQNASDLYSLGSTTPRSTHSL
ncbi:amidohydrolase family protein [Humidisolicoccus flavus]|uniref:amidohydrolase family protein n=1 Tax=Humidisolicoccus flavus TaxID=3111414 RepID=UPI0032518BB8